MVHVLETITAIAISKVHVNAHYKASTESAFLCVMEHHVSYKY